VTVVVIAVVAALIVIAVVIVVARRRRPVDGVASFRRQIDALSPEARRPVVDRVQALEDDDDDERGERHA
jgi:hypothetical protein